MIEFTIDHEERLIVATVTDALLLSELTLYYHNVRELIIEERKSIDIECDSLNLDSSYEEHLDIRTLDDFHFRHQSARNLSSYIIKSQMPECIKSSTFYCANDFQFSMVRMLATVIDTVYEDVIIQKKFSGINRLLARYAGDEVYAIEIDE